ncbi:MAG: ImmA/IrrE family metallo-endopeptidase [Gemmiger sp.]
MSAASDPMYDDLNGLGVDIADLKLKANVAIAFWDDFLVIDRTKCKTAAQERTVLAHEAGHYLSGAFYRAASPYEVREQAEYKAQAASFERYLPPEAIRAAMRAGYTEPWQLAEYFDLEEDYIKKALHYWTECRGIRFSG